MNDPELPQRHTGFGYPGEKTKIIREPIQLQSEKPDLAPHAQLLARIATLERRVSDLAEIGVGSDSGSS